jgi:hypothetical protein
VKIPGRRSFNYPGLGHAPQGVPFQYTMWLKR